MTEELAEMEVPSTDCDNRFCFTRSPSAQQRQKHHLGTTFVTDTEKLQRSLLFLLRDLML